MKAEYITHMGDDLTVVNSARVSFNKISTEFTTREQKPKGSDEGLIDYLSKHDHWTPFSQPQIQMREKVPIIVARQRFKHMVGFTYNEVSRRYVDDDPEFFVPLQWRARPDGSVKQGSSEEVITHIVDASHHCEYLVDIHEAYTDFLAEAEELYKRMIKTGVAPEMARMVLPQSMYTEYVVTGSLAAWARAYKQRVDSHAQKEIQNLATQWGEIIEPLFPYSWRALTC